MHELADHDKACNTLESCSIRCIQLLVFESQQRRSPELHGSILLLSPTCFDASSEDKPVCAGTCMSFLEVRHVGIIMAKALQSLHAAGILHLGLKPANVLMDAESNPVLGDFSISHHIQNAMTITVSSARRGSPNYAYAPI